MTVSNNVLLRGHFHVRDRVRTTRRFRRLYPKNNAREGVLLSFCRGTEVRVQFDDHKCSVPIDERFLEKV